MQDWRAIAKFGNGKEALVVLGATQFQVSQTYQESFLEIIHPDIQSVCTGITLQRWKGEPQRGKWVDVGALRLPGC